MNNELIKLENNDLVATSEGIKFIKKVQKAKVQLTMMEEELKKAFLTAMEETGVNKFVSPDGSFKATYYGASKQNRLDTKKLKEECPDIYEKYLTTSDKKTYVKFS